MNATPISILMYGHDAHLLETSQWALRSRGYRVLTMTDLSEIKGIPTTPAVDLLVLGNTLTQKESAEVFAQAAARWPRIKRLALGHEYNRADIFNSRLLSKEIPVRLIATVSDMVGYAGSSSCSHTY